MTASTTLADNAITRFFRQFERNSDSGEISSLAHQFADTFMVAGPQGAQCVRAADFALALPRRKQFFDSLGCRSTSLVSVEEHQLDSRFVTARTRWRWVFLQSGEEKEALADSTFIVDTSAQNLKIVFYLAHQDTMIMLKEQGIFLA